MAISRKLLNKNKIHLDRMGNIDKKSTYVVFQNIFGQNIPMFSHEDKNVCEEYITEYLKITDEYRLFIK